jgi:polar amino acid transport system substrate-binding protein
MKRCFSNWCLVGKICLLSLPLIMLGACSNSAALPVSRATSTYDRVMKSGVIRCGYAVYNPGCLKDANTGKLSGIGVDTLELAAKHLGLKVEWTEEVGWGTMIEGLETNRYDIVATPVWATSDRARVVDFSKPLYYSPVFAYVKAGNKKITAATFKALNSSKYSIASIDGATAEIIAREDFPDLKRVSLPQLSDFSQLLLTVTTGKADLTFTEPADAAAFMQHNPGTVERVGGPVRVFPNCWIFRRDQMEFKNMLNTALDQITNSGAEDKIIGKYEPAPNTLYRVAAGFDLPPSLSSVTLDKPAPKTAP